MDQLVASHLEATTVRVLCVEDSNTQADLIMAFLRDERLAAQSGGTFSVARVADLAGALAQLHRDERFDVVLLDLTLPDSSGVETLDRVKEATDLPVVVLSASDESLGLEMVQHGAQDFVIKDARSLPSLPRTLRYAVMRAQLVRDLAVALEAREDADARLRTFVSMASHELRSPIAALRGLSELLNTRWDQLTEEQRRDMALRIDRRLGHTHAVATLYLNAAAGDDAIHAVPESVDLVRMATDVAGSVPAPPDEVSVTEGTVRFDPSHLAAILVNFLTNAAKYGTAPVRLEGDARQLVVSDGGEGVAPEDVAMLFEPWHRRARAGVDSTGLGLALAGQLARANGAELRYERAGNRTRFVLDLQAR